MFSFLVAICYICEFLKVLFSALKNIPILYLVVQMSLYYVSRPHFTNLVGLFLEVKPPLSLRRRHHLSPHSLCIQRHKRRRGGEVEVQSVGRRERKEGRASEQPQQSEISFRWPPQSHLSLSFCAPKKPPVKRRKGHIKRGSCGERTFSLSLSFFFRPPFSTRKLEGKQMPNSPISTRGTVLTHT